MEPLVAVVGETGSGKSALALTLAQKFDGEIIAADAMTVYKGFDIGTAKPSLQERARVPHHLLDIAEADKSFSAAQFQKRAYEAMRDIQGRGKLPILAGGSGLYVDSVLFNYTFRPRASAELRKQLEGMSLEELHEVAWRGGFDLEAIDKHNKRRVIRLIETSGSVVEQQPMRENTLVIGIALERHELLKRVEQRVEAMLTAGLEQEVRLLSERYGWTVEPMKSIGYREWRAYFEGSVSQEEVRQSIVMNTMRLAKKQRTWFRRNKSIHWVHEQVEAVALVTTLLNK